MVDNARDCSIYLSFCNTKTRQLNDPSKTNNTQTLSNFKTFNTYSNTKTILLDINVQVFPSSVRVRVRVRVRYMEGDL